MRYKKLFLTLSCSVFSIISFSQTFISNSKSLPALQVIYSSQDKDMMSMDVVYENADGSTFQLVIVNERGETLYKNTYHKKKLAKTFRIPKEQSKLKVTISDVVNGSVRRFDISPSIAAELISGISY